jgi:tetratricopeptide (TPR) repeat protein
VRGFFRRSSQPSPITLADRARDSGQWELAAAHYRIALRRTPRNSAIWVQYGHALKESGDLAAAETAYRRGIEDNPTAGDPYLHLGHILKLQARIPKKPGWLIARLLPGSRR